MLFANFITLQVLVEVARQPESRQDKERRGGGHNGCHEGCEPHPTEQRWDMLEKRDHHNAVGRLYTRLQNLHRARCEKDWNLHEGDQKHPDPSSLQQDEVISRREHAGDKRRCTGEEEDPYEKLRDGETKRSSQRAGHRPVTRQRLGQCPQVEESDLCNYPRGNNCGDSQHGKEHQRICNDHAVHAAKSSEDQED